MFASLLQDSQCWECGGQHDRTLRGDRFLSLLSTQIQSDSTHRLSLRAALFLFCHCCGCSSGPSHSPCSQLASLQPIITIAICLKCRLVRITLQLKIIRCLPLPPSTQNRVHILDPDIPLCCFSLNSCQPWSLIR